jgi:hypothetical protein
VHALFVRRPVTDPAERAVTTTTTHAHAVAGWVCAACRHSLRATLPSPSGRCFNLAARPQDDDTAGSKLDAARNAHLNRNSMHGGAITQKRTSKEVSTRSSHNRQTDTHTHVTTKHQPSTPAVVGHHGGHQAQQSRSPLSSCVLAALRCTATTPKRPHTKQSKRGKRETSKQAWPV